MNQSEFWNPKTELLDRERLRGLQLHKLRNLVEWADARSRFYRRSFAKAGFRPEQLESWDDIQRIPFLTREEWMASQESVPPYGELPVAGPESAVRLHTTSGTSGRTPLRALDTRRDAAAIAQEGRTGEHAFPLLDGDDPVGLVEIRRTPPLSAAAISVVAGLLRIYRSHLGILDQNQTDELTGLSNRKPFEDAFRRLSQVADPPRGVRGELAIVDIDHFKRVNDCFGHVYGDEVLVLIAAILKRSFREGDRVFRFGGEEFAVLLAGVGPADAGRALERFRAEVAAYAFPQVGRATVSLGVTSIRANETGLEAFGRADEALYVAKRTGRNRCLRYETLLAAGAVAGARRDSDAIELF